MSTTVQDIIYDARALLDSYTDDGVVIAAEDLADFTASCVRFADIGQKELFEVGRIQKTIEFANSPIKNELGEEFNIVEFLGDDEYYPSENGVVAKSYYFEADNAHTVNVQEYEGGVRIDLVTNSATVTTMTSYQGNLTPTTVGNLIRLKFTGTTFYRHTNRALYNVAFQSDESVPKYQAWVELTLPTNFKSLDSVVEEYESRQYGKSATYKFEAPNRFYYNYYFKGLLRIVYNPIPITLTAVTDVLEIDDIVAKALAFYVASWISPYENQSMTNPLFQKYEELKREAMTSEPATEEAIQDVYAFSNSSFYSDYSW